MATLCASARGVKLVTAPRLLPRRGAVVAAAAPRAAEDVSKAKAKRLRRKKRKDAQRVEHEMAVAAAVARQTGGAKARYQALMACISRCAEGDPDCVESCEIEWGGAAAA